MTEPKKYGDFSFVSVYNDTETTISGRGTLVIDYGDNAEERYFYSDRTSVWDEPKTYKGKITFVPDENGNAFKVTQRPLNSAPEKEVVWKAEVHVGLEPTMEDLDNARELARAPKSAVLKFSSDGWVDFIWGNIT